jgi:hypothetical protein
MAKKWARNIDAAIQTVDKQDEQYSSTQTSEYWKPTKIDGQDKTSYVVRILPDPGSDDGTDWVLRKAHMINFPGGKRMYEPCPKKTRGSCPICEHVAPLFKSGNPEDERIAYDHYAKKRYFMNVLIVSDERDNKANEGQVRLWECPKKVMEEIKTESGFPNYGMSRLQGQEPIGTDEEIDEIMEKATNLRERLLSESCFKSNDELWHMYTNNGERLNSDGDSNTSAATTSASSSTNTETANTETVETKKESAPVQETPKAEKSTSTASTDVDDDEDFDLDDDFDLDEEEIENMV